MNAPSQPSEPLVSIVVPCYQGERYLPETLRSCLAQTHANLEIIVVDDASPDGCGKIAGAFAAHDPRIRVVRLPQNVGVAGAFNAGFAVARGDYFTRLAQDDLFLEGAIARMVSCLTEHREVGLVYCDEQGMDEHGNIIRAFTRPEAGAVLVEGSKIGLCVMWRREVWEQVGKFDSRFDTAEDYDYWMRVREKFQVAKCPGGPQMSMRLHADMGSKVFSDKQEILAARIRARYCRGLKGRKVLEQGYFNAAYNCRCQGRHGRALKHLLTAWGYWPFDVKLYRLFAGVGLRMIGLRQSS
jgi:glycosyltransferase involved in cell wall biosynthesis